jgi:hypothetical protein
VECEAAVRQRPFLMSPSRDLSMSAFEPRTDMVNRLSMSAYDPKRTRCSLARVEGSALAVAFRDAQNVHIPLPYCNVGNITSEIQASA